MVSGDIISSYKQRGIYNVKRYAYTNCTLLLIYYYYYYCFIFRQVWSTQ